MGDHKYQMSNDRRSGVRVEAVAPYRAAIDNGTAKLKEDFADVIKVTRANVAKICNVASVAGIALTSGVALEWEPGVTKTMALVLTAALACAPQWMKHVTNKELGAFEDYKESLSPYVDQLPGERNADASRKQAKVLSGWRETDRGRSYEAEAFVFLAMTALSFLNHVNDQTGANEKQALVVAFLTGMMSAAAVFLARNKLEREKKEFGAGADKFLSHIPAPTRVAIDDIVADEAEARSGDNEKPRKANG